MDAAPATRASRAGRIAAVVVLVGLALLWIYALSGRGRPGTADVLDDRSFPAEAEPVCAAAREDLVPYEYRQADSPVERAALATEANRTLAAMLEDLRLIEPRTPRDRRLVSLWLADWRTDLQDRVDWADANEQGEDVRFFETLRHGEPISETIDYFATANDMPSCATPDNV